MDTDALIGRFVPVDANPKLQVDDWPGWERFEENVREAVFVYGSVMHPDDLRALLGREPVLGSDYLPARLEGYRRRWSVASDNLLPDRKIVYYTPGTDTRVPYQILFMNVEQVGEGAVEGLVLMVDDALLRELDVREGNYDRVNVTGAVIADGLKADAVWTYVGKSRAVEAATQGRAAGTAQTPKASTP